jgi:hypothetical protein
MVIPMLGNIPVFYRFNNRTLRLMGMRTVVKMALPEKRAKITPVAIWLFNHKG